MAKQWLIGLLNFEAILDFAGLVVNYAISNTYVLEIPYFTTKPAILASILKL